MHSQYHHSWTKEQLRDKGFTDAAIDDILTGVPEIPEPPCIPGFATSDDNDTTGTFQLIQSINELDAEEEMRLCALEVHSLRMEKMRMDRERRNVEFRHRWAKVEELAKETRGDRAAFILSASNQWAGEWTDPTLIDVPSEERIQSLIAQRDTVLDAIGNHPLILRPETTATETLKWELLEKFERFLILRIQIWAERRRKGLAEVSSTQ
ncbi:hypothetical protein FA95DRAFT_1611340 [Auriscalpium vulgare]|uniref:Uncharacterized protein n=1 Tax=Auriscalpium vulgare TaxID=40419 RepID=A0ACB8RBU4_9AGAM|nr:hypothetical protein FA95DRAFT_1611340 [Auriscalpium vulgare]